MKRYLFWITFILLSLPSFGQKIALNPAMLSYYQEQGNPYIDLSPLADEQSLLTDTLADHAVTPKPATVFIPSWGTAPQVQVHLGSSYKVSRIAIFDSWNQAKLTVKYDATGTWVTLFAWDMSYSEAWQVASVNVTTDKLLFIWDGLNAQVAELAVFGSANTGDSPVPAAPGNLTASAVTSSNATLSWSASTGKVEVSGYEVYKNDTLLSTVSDTSTTVAGLRAATTYLFKVKAKDAANNQSAFSKELSVTTQSGGPCVPDKLVLTPAMVVNQSGQGDAGMLVDEQSLAGNPAQGPGGAPTTHWQAGWNAASYPVSAYIDFGRPTTITAIYLRDMQDSGPLTIQTGEPDHWVTLISDSLKGYLSWNQHNVKVTSRYLRFTLSNFSANIAEVVIYGCHGPVPDTIPPAAVTTLSTGVISPDSIQLSWTATGGDGTTGTAASYEVRYSTSPFTSAMAFERATLATGVPDPLSAGNAQSFFVPGLRALTTYYFAMKVKDEANNTSALSNSVSATTAAGSAGTAITIDKFIGANAFVDDPVNKMQAVGFIREYHNWNWDEGDIWSGAGNRHYSGYPKNQIKWAPSEAGGGSWNFDTFYSSVLAGGLEIAPCIHGSVSWLHGNNNFPGSDKPTDEPGVSTTDPNSYEKKAHHLYQFAARYGATAVPDSKLTLAPGQPRNSGMGLVKYLEDWNEQDRNWEGANAQFSPQEYAAMASADYDGHAGTMTQGTGTFGLKNADPNMKLVMGGIFQLNLDYIKQMKAWFEANRPDRKFAVDVINVHHYTFAGSGPALSPEEADFKGKMKEFVDYRNQYLPGVEVWLSEFGWDTHPNSVLRPYVAAPFDLQEVQGQWIVRAYLALAAAGVDRAQQFMLRDVNPKDAGQFSTSGLVGQKNDWTPKKSWYYVYTLKNTLQNMVFIGEQDSGDPNVLIYKFKEVNSSNGAYVVWARTKENYTVNGYNLTLTHNPASATKVEMEIGDTDGLSSNLSISAGKVSINVSERPVFVKVDNIQ